jgi:hypothetical protein
LSGTVPRVSRNREIGKFEDACEHYELSARYSEQAENPFSAGTARRNMAQMYVAAAARASQRSEQRAVLLRAHAYSEAAAGDFAQYMQRTDGREGNEHSKPPQHHQSKACGAAVSVDSRGGVDGGRRTGERARRLAVGAPAPYTLIERPRGELETPAELSMISDILLKLLLPYDCQKLLGRKRVGSLRPVLDFQARHARKIPFRTMSLPCRLRMARKRQVMEDRAPSDEKSQKVGTTSPLAALLR